MPNTELSYLPSAVVYSDRLLILHAGGGDVDRLWYVQYLRRGRLDWGHISVHCAALRGARDSCVQRFSVHFPQA